MSQIVTDFPHSIVEGPALDADLPARRTYNAGLLKAYVVGTDLGAIVLGMLPAYALSRAIHSSNSRTTLPANMTLGALAIPLWIAAFAGYRLQHTVRCDPSGRAESARPRDHHGDHRDGSVGVPDR